MRYPLFPYTFLAVACCALAQPFQTAAPIPGKNGLELREFAKEPFLRNVVAVTVDEDGHVYATSTLRRKAADLDIRQFRGWIEQDLSFQTVEDRRRFYHQELAPDAERNYGRIGDQNQDGSTDWKDLTVLSDRIIRVTDTDGDGVADQATTFAEEFNTEITGVAAGVTAWDRRIYATVEPDAWALKDSTGDGIADQRTSLAHGFSVHIAYAGHNFSGPIVGPDGRLYVSSADKGLHLTTPEGAVISNPHSGAIVRMELDGSHPELFAYGLRNVQEPAFDPFGNLFGVDNDGDMRGEKERFVYITEGSDTGWRSNWQYREKGYQPWLEEGLYVPEHPAQAAYITPALGTYKDGPTGFAFNPGTALNPHYRDHFFLTAFPSRKMYAFKVEPDGPVYRMVDEHQVASGVLMTGLAFGPDGALYVADWSAKGYELNDRGGVWKLDDPTQANSKERKTTTSLIQRDWGAAPLADLETHLGHADQRVRMKAQFELVRRNAVLPLSAAAAGVDQNRMGRLHAIWGLGQLFRRAEQLDSDPLTPLLSDPDEEIRAQVAKVIGEIPGLREAASAPLRDMVMQGEDRVAFFAAIALGRLNDPAAFPAVVTHLERRGEHPYHRHAGVMGLVGTASPEQLAGLADHASVPVRLAAVVALRRLAAPHVAVFLDDDRPEVVAEAARAIHDDRSIPLAFPALAGLLPQSDPLPEPVVRRALSTALRLRKPAYAGMVAAYAAQEIHPMDMRLLALELLHQWPQPEVLDSVEGRYRPLAPVAPGLLRDAVQEALTELAESSYETLAEKAREAGSVYGIGTDPRTLLEQVKKDREGAAHALRLLVDADPVVLGKAIDLAKRSRHPAVRAAALEAATLRDPSQLPQAAEAALAKGSLLEQRTALRLLGASSEPAAAPLLIHTLRGMGNGTTAPELALDALEAAGASAHASVRQALTDYVGNRDTQDPLAPFLETLVGGDALKGRDLFNNHVAAQCIRCHVVNGPGSDVGPPLAGIGNKEPRFILESLVVPGAAVAEGYGVLTLETHSGETISGFLDREDDQAVWIQPAGLETTTRIAKTDLAERSPLISSMPPMGYLLNKQELRDLMAYLRSLR